MGLKHFSKSKLPSSSQEHLSCSPQSFPKESWVSQPSLRQEKHFHWWHLLFPRQFNTCSGIPALTSCCTRCPVTRGQSCAVPELHSEPQQKTRGTCSNHRAIPTGSSSTKFTLIRNPGSIKLKHFRSTLTEEEVMNHSDSLLAVCKAGTHIWMNSGIKPTCLSCRIASLHWFLSHLHVLFKNSNLSLKDQRLTSS